MQDTSSISCPLTRIRSRKVCKCGLVVREHHAGVSDTHELAARVTNHLPGEDAYVLAGYGREAALQYRTNTSLHEAVNRFDNTAENLRLSERMYLAVGASDVEKRCHRAQVRCTGGRFRGGGGCIFIPAEEAVEKASTLLQACPAVLKRGRKQRRLRRRGPHPPHRLHDALSGFVLGQKMIWGFLSASSWFITATCTQRPTAWSPGCCRGCDRRWTTRTRRRPAGRAWRRR